MKSKFNHWNKPNSRSYKKALQECNLPPARKPRICYAHAEMMRQLCFKLLDKLKHKGDHFTLTKTQIAHDLSIRLGRTITERQIKDGLSRLRVLESIVTSQLYQRSKILVFDVIDIGLLQSEHDRYDAILRDNAPRQRPVHKPVDKSNDVTLNVTHGHFKRHPGHFKRQPYLNHNLNHNLNQIQDSSSGRNQGAIFDRVTRGMYKDRERRQLTEYEQLGYAKPMRRSAEPERVVPDYYRPETVVPVDRSSALSFLQVAKGRVERM